MSISSPTIQEVIETIEKLPSEDQNLVVEIIQNRLIEQQRMALLHEIAEARADYRTGNVHRGSVEDLMAELSE